MAHNVSPSKNYLSPAKIHKKPDVIEAIYGREKKYTGMKIKNLESTCGSILILGKSKIQKIKKQVLSGTV